MLTARCQRVAVVTALFEAGSPAPLQGFINDERQRAAKRTEGLHQQRQQAAATLEGGPASTVEHVIIEAERWGIALPGVSQGRGDGAPSAGQQGSDNQALDFTPSGCAEETLKGCQGGATVS